MAHREKRGTLTPSVLEKKCHSSRDGENSGPRPSNHSLWWCVGKERAQTFNHQTNMWKGWFIWNYRGRETQTRPFLPLECEWDERKWTNEAVCSVGLWHLTPQMSHLMTLDVDVINLGGNIVSQNMLNRIPMSSSDSLALFWGASNCKIQLRLETNNVAFC